MADKLTISEPVSMYPWAEYKGWVFPNTPPMKEKGAEKHFQDLRNFKSRETDILMCSQMRTGTHWLHEIISMLLCQTTEYNSMGPWWEMNLEYLCQPEAVDKITSPRILATHVPFCMLPKQHLDNGYKIIYLRRNPKDRCVSLKCFLHGKLGHPTWTWPEFFDEIIMEDKYYSGWFNYTKEMAEAMANKAANIFCVSYENLVIEPKKSITDLAHFLEVPFTNQFIDDIVEKCKFNNLKSKKLDASMIVTLDKESTTFRKGKIGDWKNWFTVAQNERFDAKYNEEMKGIDLDFIYEHP